MKAMTFEIDSQTLKDLDVFDTSKQGKSVFGLFNFTQCLGGRRKLYSFLSAPSANLSEITERKETIAFFQKHFPQGISIDKNALDFTEYYVRHANFTSSKPSRFSFLDKILDKINRSNKSYIIAKGVRSTSSLLKSVYDFSSLIARQIAEGDAPQLLVRSNAAAMRIFAKPEFEEMLGKGRLKAYDIARLDYTFRQTHRADVQFFLNMVYEYDAYMSVAKATEVHGLSYPEILPDTERCLNIEGLFHPFVDNVTANDISFADNANLLLISGPNMAGKSTFLKALGIAVYLAHVGFPVPAAKMKINLLSGLCTTINISDNLDSGYSHFYAEVMRIKDVADKLSQSKNMLVIFDELFRGTNVKDAYDGTLAISTALSTVRDSFFVISTHIVEAAKALESNPKVQFGYFEVLEQQGEPVYTYRMKEGISDVRLGMYIINRERIIEQINNIGNEK